MLGNSVVVGHALKRSLVALGEAQRQEHRQGTPLHTMHSFCMAKNAGTPFEIYFNTA